MKRLLLIAISVIFACACNVSDTTPVYTLQTSVHPEQGGTVSPDSGHYEEGEHILIEAQADSGYVFTGWGGDLSGENNPDSLYFDSDKQITAIFEEKVYTLNIETEGRGDVHEEVVSSKTDYPEGTEVQLTAEPRDGWEFSHWEKDIEGDENPVTITIEEETTVKAVFVEEDDSGDNDNGGGSDDPPNNYTVTTGTDGEGSVSLEPHKEEYEEGEEVTVKANSDDGWKFSHWRGDLSGEANPETITIEKDTDITAVFEEIETDEPEEYSVDIHVKNNEGGTVDINPDQGSYEEGEEITVTANPDADWEFVEWEGDFPGSENPLQFNIDEDKNITAVFREKDSDDDPDTTYYTLHRQTEGNGTVWWEPYSDTDEIPEGTELTIGANAADGWEFSHWEGDFQGSSNPIENVEIDRDMTFTAVFDETDDAGSDPDPEFFSITTDTRGEGEITLDPDASEYEEGSEIVVEAVADDGWEFSHWEGDFSGSENPVNFNIDENKEITAVFEETAPETYTMNISTTGEGEVDLQPDKQEYDDGEEVQVTAESAEGWEFSHWEGDFSGSENPVTFNIDQDKDIVAVFEEVQPEIYTIETQASGEGEIVLTPDQFEYEEDTEITVEAQAESGWEFSHWEGDFSGSENPVTFEIDQDKFITAIFEQDEKVIEAGEVSHGFIPGFTPSNDPDFQNRSYPVIQANWEGEGGDKRWTARNLGATDDPQGFEDNDPHRAGWYFYFNDSQGHFWDGVPAERRQSWTTPTIYGGSSGDADFNDPCKVLGEDWRTPTVAEWEALAAADVADEMNFHEGGALNDGGKYAGSGKQDVSRYWSSEQVGTRPEFIYYEVHSNGEITQELQYGYVRDILTVRCIED